LRCLVRSFSDLARVNSSVPSNAKAVRGSVIVRTEGRIQRVIFVALSEDAPPEQQFIGALTRKIELIAWPSACDVICLYDRPGAAGDVGQVTQAVVRRVGRSRTNLYGTGRAMSIVRDLLVGRYTKRSDCQFSS